jgi:NADPH-dependent ferric siderophore reductase
MRPILVAEAAVPMEDALRVLPMLVRHLGEHGLHVEDGDGVTRMSGRGSVLTLKVEAGRLVMQAEASRLSDLLSARALLASHLLEFSAVRPVDIVWTGDATEATTPAEFRLMTVTGVRRLSPAMQRVTLAGDDLERFASARDLHCKLLLPRRPGATTHWPQIGRNGLTVWSDDEDRRPFVRKYTIRNIDVSKGNLDIDFVLHGDHGPGSRFGRRATVGDEIGMMGPGGLGLRPANSTLLLGDETALPAIARSLEALPRDARGMAIIEVANIEERQSIDAPAGFEVHWLYRDEPTTADSHRLAQSLLNLPAPERGADVFAWLGCEMTAFKTIRRHLRTAWSLQKGQHHLVAYWQRSHLSNP